MDWIAHISFALILGLGYSKMASKQLSLSLLALGAVLPDLFKLHYLFLRFGEMNAMNFFAPYHTVIGALLASLAATVLFKMPSKECFATLASGSAMHFALDGLLWPFGKGVSFFWPFYTFYTPFGLVWPDSYVPTVVFGLGAIILFSLERVLSSKKVKPKNE